MLRHFTVGNFMGFKDRISLDLSARTYAFNENLIRNKTVGTGLIYGKNGTGKTNLGLAIFDIVNVLTDNHKGRLLTIQNYKNLDSGGPTVEFEYEFLLGGRTVAYRYGKESPANLIYEELVVNGETVLSFDLRKGAGSFLNNIKTNNPINSAPYLRLLENKAASYNIALLKYIYRGDLWREDHYMSLLFEFVNHMLWVRSLNKGNEFIGLAPAEPNIDETIIRNDKIKEFQQFLKANGINYQLVAGDFNGQRILCAKFKNRLVALRGLMSSGTAFLRLFFGWSLLFDKVSFLYLDEFDAYYHYETAEFVFRELGKHHGMQVLATTHNTYLMKNSIARPDVCFILSGNRIRCLSDCSDKEIREAHNLEKMYRNGAFANE